MKKLLLVVVCMLMTLGCSTNQNTEVKTQPKLSERFIQHATVFKNGFDYEDKTYHLVDLIQTSDMKNIEGVFYCESEDYPHGVIAISFTNDRYELHEFRINHALIAQTAHMTYLNNGNIRLSILSESYDKNEYVFLIRVSEDGDYAIQEEVS